MTDGSALQPVGHLEQERVVRVGVEQVTEVAGERLRALRRRGVLPPLVPHEEQGRARAILPPHHQVGPELLEVELAGARHRIRLVAVVVRRGARLRQLAHVRVRDRKSTRLNSSHDQISYAVFCLKKKKKATYTTRTIAT